MGAFIGYGDRGVWANNRERDAFLDWFAAARCSVGDERWNWCKSPVHRWTGFCFDLEEILPRDRQLQLTPEEYQIAAKDFWPHLAQILSIIDAISRNSWQFRVDSPESVNWRVGEGPERKVYQRLGLLD